MVRDSDDENRVDVSPEEARRHQNSWSLDESANGSQAQWEAKAVEYQAMMRAAAEGDLTVRMETAHEDDAFSDIDRAFNEMMDSLESTMLNVWSFSGDVGSVGEHVASGSVEIEAASERVTENIHDISDRTNDQSDSLQAVTEEMNDISATIQEIAASTNEVAETAGEASGRGEEGREAAEQAITEINQVVAASDDIVDKVAELDEQMSEIDEIIDVITDIAEQTNILALNANIEAARSSGNNGGFAVVADEVKNLAGETKEAVQQIERVIRKSQSHADATVTHVRSTSESISSSSRTIEDALEALTDTVEYVDQANNGIQEISKAVDNQAAANERVVTELAQVTEISEEIDEQAGEVASAAQQQASSITSVSRQAGDLHDSVGSLEDSMSEFAANRWGKRITDHCLEADIDWRQCEETTLTFGMSEHMFTRSTEPLLEYFEELTGIRVEYEIHPEERLFEELQADFQSRSGHFDGCYLALWSGANYQYSGWIRDLTDFFEDPTMTDKGWYHIEDYPESGLAAFTYGDGELVALPFGFEVYGCLAYDKPTFQKLGLDEPTDFESLRETARIIHESDAVDRAGIVSRGSSDTLSTANWVTMFKSYGADWLDYRTKASTLNSPEGVASLEMYADIFGQYGPSDVGTYDWYKANNRYGKGDFGMIYHAPGAGGVISDEQRSRTKWLPPLAGPDGERVAGLWAWALGINEFSENPDAAWLFLQWATCRPMNLLLSTKQWQDHGSYGHARGEWIFEQPEYEKRGQPESWVTAHREGMKLVPSRPPPVPLHTPQNMEIMTEASQAMNDVLTSSTSAQTALDTAAQRITDIAKQIPPGYLDPQR